MSKVQMHECQVNIIKNTIVYMNVSAFSTMAIYNYKLHLVAFYTVNECKLFDLSQCIHRIEI